jgi:putative transposase
VLGLEVGLSEDVALWRAFLQDLVARGVRGVQLVTSDAHPGLKQAIAEVFVGASWQRCKVHFVRNLLARVPKAAQSMVAATVRTVFEQPDRQAAGHRLRYVCTTLEARFPAVVQLLEDAEGEILTFYDFPVEHRRAVASTNPLERLNRELKRRSAVVGIFPNRTAVLRLFSALLAEQNDEWLVGHQYMSRGSLRQLRPADGAAAPQATNDLKDTDEREATTPAA